VLIKAEALANGSMLDFSDGGDAAPPNIRMKKAAPVSWRGFEDGMPFVL